MTKRKHPHPAADIKWRSCDSSNVEAIGWDNKAGVYILFKSGGLYLYPGVSRQRAVAAWTAESTGAYVNKIIIPNYESVKIA